MNSNIAAEAVNIAARDHSFHPVRDWLASLKWDGTRRIERWLTTYLGAEDSIFVRAAARRWLISAVARVFAPGCQADFALVLQGDQGIGKSTAIRILGGDWYLDGLSNLHSKDSMIELNGKWLVELSELAAIRRADLETVKRFLSTKSDNYRPPYARTSEEHPRQCVFCGTTNSDAPLTDTSGNRRFLPIPVIRLQRERLERDRNMLWAEAVKCYRGGETWYLDSDELIRLATEAQDAALAPDPWDEAVLNWCDSPKSSSLAGASELISTPGKVLSSEVLEHCLGIALKDRSDGYRTGVAGILKKNHWEKRQGRYGPGSKLKKEFYFRK